MGDVDGQSVGGATMKGCHNCGHAAEIAGGKYKDVPWKDMPCASCDVMSSSAGTRCVDEDRMAVSEHRGTVEWSCVEPEREEELLVPLDVLGVVVNGLMAMTPVTRDAVCWRFQGLKYREIAERQGVTVSAVEQRHWRAMKRWPELRQLFVVKARKQKRREGDIEKKR